MSYTDLYNCRIKDSKNIQMHHNSNMAVTRLGKKWLIQVKLQLLLNKIEV